MRFIGLRSTDRLHSRDTRLAEIALRMDLPREKSLARCEGIPLSHGNLEPIDKAKREAGGGFLARFCEEERTRACRFAHLHKAGGSTNCQKLARHFPAPRHVGFSTRHMLYVYLPGRVIQSSQPAKMHKDDCDPTSPTCPLHQVQIAANSYHMHILRCQLLQFLCW